MASQSPRPRTKGLVIVFTGEGKGKTTAALGMAMRSAGHHYRVAVIQFIKGTMRAGRKRPRGCWRPTSTGRWAVAASPPVRGIGPPRGAPQGWPRRRCGSPGEADLRRVPTGNPRRGAGGHRGGERDPGGRCWPSSREAPGDHLVLTGLGVPPEIVESLRPATEMRVIKHPYVQGIVARRRGVLESNTRGSLEHRRELRGGITLHAPLVDGNASGARRRSDATERPVPATDRSRLSARALDMQGIQSPTGMPCGHFSSHSLTGMHALAGLRTKAPYRKRASSSWSIAIPRLKVSVLAGMSTPLDRACSTGTGCTGSGRARRACRGP